MDEKIVRLYAYNTEGEEVGRTVLDITKLIDMYAAAYLKCHVQGNEVEGEVIREQTTAPRGEYDEFVEEVTPHVGWWKKASDGTLYMKRRPG